MHRPTEVNTIQDFTQSHTVIPSTHLLTARRKCSTTVYKDLSRNHGYLVDQYTQSIIPAYLHTVILVGLKLHEVIPTVRYLEKVILTLDFYILILQNPTIECTVWVQFILTLEFY